MESLFNDDESIDLIINKDYAKKYEKFKERQEINRITDKYGKKAVNNEDDESSSDTEINVAESLQDSDFLRTLSLLKENNEIIYDRKIKSFYNQEKQNISTKIAKKKPLTLKDYERTKILETIQDNGGKNLKKVAENKYRPNNISYNKDQLEIKNKLRKLVDDFEIDSAENSYKDESFGGILKKRESNVLDEMTVLAQHINYLKSEDSNELPIQSKKSNEFDFLKKYWEDKNLDEKEQFLRDYILNQGYVIRDEKIPTYNEIVDSSISDEENLEICDKFESDFNFRFEENNSNVLSTHDRRKNESSRIEQSKRKRIRQSHKEHLKERKQQFSDDVKRLKNLKKKEIQQKLDRINEISGLGDYSTLEKILKDDFDPETYDQLMNNLFNQGYYNEKESMIPEITDEKCLQIIESSDLKIPSEDNLSRRKRKKLAVQNRMNNNDLIDETSQKVVERIEEKYLDQLYEMDCEDVVAGIPVRFGYRTGKSENFGLLIEEILTADNKELNRWCPLNKVVKFKNPLEEKKDHIIYRNKSKNIQKKKLIFSSIYRSDEQNEHSTKNVAKSTKNVAKSTKNVAKSTKSVDLSTDSVLLKESEHIVDELQQPTDLKKISMEDNSFTTNKNLRRTLTKKHFKYANPKVVKQLSTNRLLAYGIHQSKNRHTK